MKWLLFLKYLLYAKTKTFVGFFGGGIVLWFPFLFVDAHWGLVFFVKAAGAIGLAFLTGIAGALGKELVDFFKQNPDKRPKFIERVFKKKVSNHKNIEDDQQRNNKAV